MNRNAQSPAELSAPPTEGLLAALNNKMQEIFRIVRTVRSIVWEIFLIALTAVAMTMLFP